MLAWMLSGAATLWFAAGALWCCYHWQRKHEAAGIVAAILRRDLTELSRLAPEQAALHSVREWFGEPALILAIQSLRGSGDLEFTLAALQLLLAGGADVNECGIQWKSALMHAAAAGSAEICELLLSHGAEPGACDAFGRTADLWAAQAGHELVACRLRRIPHR